MGPAWQVWWLGDAMGVLNVPKLFPFNDEHHNAAKWGNLRDAASSMPHLADKSPRQFAGRGFV
jgi:integral membrane sensor domain MASE1